MGKGEGQRWRHFSHRLVFPHHLVGAGITAWLQHLLPLLCQAPAPGLSWGAAGTQGCSSEVPRRSGTFAPQCRQLPCAPVPLTCALVSPPGSSQAQEARHAAALRHRVPRVRVRAGHQGDQRAHRVWRLPKVRAAASLPPGGLVQGLLVVTAT